MASQPTKNSDNNFGSSVLGLAVLVGIVLFCIHLIFSVVRGDENPIPTAIIQTFDFDSSDH